MNFSLRATEEGSQLCEDVPHVRAFYQELPPSWIKYPPSPLSSSIFTYVAYSVHIINRALTGSCFKAIGPSDVFTSVWIKVCKCLYLS